jgi:hypothetical protein
MSKKKKSQARRNRLDPKKEPAKKEKEAANPTTTAQAPTSADETAERKRANSTDPTAIATVGGTKNPESADLKKALKFPRIESWIADLSSPWSKWPLMPAGKQHGVGWVVALCFVVAAS